ncbi:hypothetical protein NDU88_000603 [Pleurodeles waltl]|uniref:Uncharacterized protein n=1 Tax=Pleurodeles waltl TaxID=8319 RepID=A0AAV7N8F5_PLEWA|nr:hypothetical protein NDU88_000603 [Pleurodeles waltl]
MGGCEIPEFSPRYTPNRSLNCLARVIQVRSRGGRCLDACGRLRVGATAGAVSDAGRREAAEVRGATLPLC